MKSKSRRVLSRRDFLKSSAAAGFTASALGAVPGGAPAEGRLRFGIVTDAHYADTEPLLGRYFRESIAKMTECVGLMNEQKVAFLIELGDFKDQDTPADEQKTVAYLRAIERCFRAFDGPAYHVLGNHDVDSISKERFLENITNPGIPPAATYYSFDCGGIHCVVLDANFRADGSPYDRGNYRWNEAYVPEAELDWLGKDLAGTRLPTIAFCHQQLGGGGILDVSNAAEVRAVLRESNRVLAAFDGHNHEGCHAVLEGIHYYTLRAMVDGSGPENSAYAVVEVTPERDIVVTGYRRAESRDFSKE